ncbi:unnamed protein product, partial [Protopolystoma xenopodis]
MEITHLVKEFVFYSSLAYGLVLNHLGLRPWYSRIEPNLIVGGLPFIHSWDAIASRENISHVVSLVETFEVKPFVLNREAAEARGLRYLALPVCDFIASPSIDQ